MAKTIKLSELSTVEQERVAIYLQAREQYLEAKEIYEVCKDTMRATFPKFYRIRTGSLIIHVRYNYVSANHTTKPLDTGTSIPVER